MWSQPKTSLLVHAMVATALLIGYFTLATGGVRAQHPDWYKTGADCAPSCGGSQLRGGGFPFDAMAAVGLPASRVDSVVAE